MTTLTIRLTHIQGRGAHYGGHHDLPETESFEKNEPDEVQVSVRRGLEGKFEHIGHVQEGSEPLQIPDTPILVPYQEFEGRRQMTFQIP